MTRNQSAVESLLNRQSWHDERLKLRSILLDCGLDEHVKWGKLCYSHEGGNVVVIQATSKYCALGFFKGTLLQDEAGALTAPGRHSQAMRQLRFENPDTIAACEDLIRDFVAKAIRLEADGRTVDFGEKYNLAYPDELQDALDADPDLAKAFDELTPGRRRGYVLYISSAKQSGTRVSRVRKCAPGILAGKGLNER